MAKRRDLKKMIECLSGELMIETLLCSWQAKTDKDRFGKITDHIIDMNEAYRRRIQNPQGIAGKRYYKKLIEDFNAEANGIYEELASLNKEKE